jgi:hypothetical protein
MEDDLAAAARADQRAEPEQRLDLGGAAGEECSRRCAAAAARCAWRARAAAPAHNATSGQRWRKVGDQILFEAVGCSQLIAGRWAAAGELPAQHRGAGRAGASAAVRGKCRASLASTSATRGRGSAAGSPPPRKPNEVLPARRAAGATAAANAEIGGDEDRPTRFGLPGCRLLAASLPLAGGGRG